MLFQALKLMAPEKAHQAALWGLKKGFGPTVQHLSTGSVEVFGCRLPTRVGLAGGADKNAEALPAWQSMGMGFVEVGTVTLHPRDGNAGERVWRMPEQSMVNWMGLPGLGVNAVGANLFAFHKESVANKKPFCVGASIASPEGKLEDMTLLADKLRPWVKFFTLNASCPNDGHDVNALQPLVNQLKAAKQGAGKVPVLVKLAPMTNEEALKRAVDAFLQAGADGFVACNTVPFEKREMLPNYHHLRWPKRDGKEVGGFSGWQLLNVSVPMVRNIRKMMGPIMPIIGVGCVHSGASAFKMIQAGATLVQVYTALTYRGPGLVTEIRKALA